jgi:hypothetical protein
MVDRHHLDGMFLLLQLDPELFIDGVEDGHFARGCGSQGNRVRLVSIRLCSAGLARAGDVQLTENRKPRPKPTLESKKGRLRYWRSTMSRRPTAN